MVFEQNNNNTQFYYYESKTNLLCSISCETRNSASNETIFVNGIVIIRSQSLSASSERFLIVIHRTTVAGECSGFRGSVRGSQNVNVSQK
jgi:hypothetical protein